MAVDNINYDNLLRKVYTKDNQGGETETYYNKNGHKLVSIYRYDKNGDGKYTDDEITKVTMFYAEKSDSYMARSFIDENKDGKADIVDLSIYKDNGTKQYPISTKNYEDLPKEEQKESMFEIARYAKYLKFGTSL